MSDSPRIAAIPAAFLMGGSPGDDWHFTDALHPETGARGYFPGAVRYVAPRWAFDAIQRMGNTKRHANPARYSVNGDQTIPAAHGGAVRAGAFFNLGLGLLRPMSGGSPYADRGTGWHAEGCLCRSCSL